MNFTQEELEDFYRFVDTLEAEIEPKHASVLLKVLYYCMKNTLSTIRFELQPSVFEQLEQGNYAEYDPMVYEDLRRCFRKIAIIAQDKDFFDFDDGFPDGVFAVPHSPDKPKLKLRALLNHCKSIGKDVSELSAEEIEPFLDRNHSDENSN